MIVHNLWKEVYVLPRFCVDDCILPFFMHKHTSLHACTHMYTKHTHKHTHNSTYNSVHFLVWLLYSALAKLF